MKICEHPYEQYSAIEFADEIAENFQRADQEGTAWQDEKWGGWSAQMNCILNKRCQGGPESIPFAYAFGMWQAATQVLRSKKRKGVKLDEIVMFRNTYDFCYQQVREQVDCDNSVA